MNIISTEQAYMEELLHKTESEGMQIHPAFDYKKAIVKFIQMLIKLQEVEDYLSSNEEYHEAFEGETKRKKRIISMKRRIQLLVS